jgi:lipopolysaccharide/colanic/teichoic acid biosynthesis glycosyltransferase
MMEEQKDETIKETILKYLERFKEWLKPNKEDSLLVQSLKMIYKVLAVLLLLVFSPVIIVVLIFVFFAAL